MRRRKPKSRLASLTIEDLENLTKDLDQEFIADTFGPMTPDAKRRWEKARRKIGRPKVGAGSKAISVTVEKTLLKEIDRIARRSKTTRARLIARGLRSVIREELSKSARDKKSA